MKSKNKKTILIGLFGLGIMVMIGIYFMINRDEKIDYIMTVGDLKVAYQEVDIVVDEIKSKNKNNLINTYAHSAQDFDWDKDYGGKKGYQYLLDDLLDQIVKIKTIQHLAIEERLLDKFDYEIFLEMCESENKEREDKIANGEVVYGLKEFSKEQYYDYFNNNLMLRLKDTLIKKGKIDILEDELRVMYEENKSYFNDLSFDEVKDSVKNLCYEKKVDLYIEEKKKEVQISYSKENLKKDIKEMIN